MRGGGRKRIRAGRSGVEGSLENCENLSSRDTAQRARGRRKGAYFSSLEQPKILTRRRHTGMNVRKDSRESNPDDPNTFEMGYV